MSQLLFALGHHGKSIKHLADMLVYGLITSGKQIEGHNGNPNQSRFAIINGVTYYFYPKPGKNDPRIEVRRAGFPWSSKVMLRSERDILRWIKSIP